MMRAVFLMSALLVCTGVLADPVQNRPEFILGEFIVKIKMANVVQLKKQDWLSRKLGSYIKSIIPEDKLVVIKRPVMESSEYVIETLSKNPLVEYIEPNFIYRISRTPNEPDLLNLWGLSNLGQVIRDESPGVKGIDIDALHAWDIETGSDQVLIAVIDTGIDYTHPDLVENIWTNQAEKNGVPDIDDDNNGYIDDIHGFNFVDDVKPTPDIADDHSHGTHVSGTIGARGDNSLGVVGVNWKASIMAVKFLDKDGSGSLESAIKSIDYAVKNGAKVISNSWGGFGFSLALKEAIERSHTAGALFIAAAGNDGRNNDSYPYYPASFDVANVISVAAIDNKGELAYFSNFGKITVHLAAPGVNIFSTTPKEEYGYKNGTSMATPHVSGVAALVWAHEPNLTNMEVRNRIFSTVTKLPGLKGEVKTVGMLNAYQALMNIMPPPDMNDPINWASTPIAFSSEHPYLPYANVSFEVRVSGAREIALYLAKFETEESYDTVSLYDEKGKLIGELSGLLTDSYSEIIKGDYVKLVFRADDYISKYGFDITKVSYRY